MVLVDALPLTRSGFVYLLSSRVGALFPAGLEYHSWRYGGCVAACLIGLLSLLCLADANSCLPYWGSPQFLHKALHSIPLAVIACFWWLASTDLSLSFFLFVLVCLLAMALVLSVLVVRCSPQHRFFFLVYPVRDLLGSRLTSVEMVALRWSVLLSAWLVILLSVSSGFGFPAAEDDRLVAWSVWLFIAGAAVHVACVFDWHRRRLLLAQQRALLRDSIAVTENVRQSAHGSLFIGRLELETACRLVPRETSDVRRRLERGLSLASLSLWHLRYPSELRLGVDRRSLSSLVDSHLSAVGILGSLEVNLRVRGAEPPLSHAVSWLLFDVVHHALANVLCHSAAGYVEVSLSFDPGRVSVTVRDDGLGLPLDYERRGRSLARLRRLAEELDGCLSLLPSGALGGAQLQVVLPL